MTNLDVSLRLQLKNQFSKPADEVKQDLKQLQTAAQRLGQTKGGALAGNLQKVGNEATEAKGKIGAVGRETDHLRQKLGQVDKGAFDGLKADARAAEQAINRVGNAATELKQKLHSARAGGIGTGGRPSGGPLRVPGAASASAGGLLDQLNLPVAMGTGAAYMAGGLVGVGAVGAGAAVNAAAGDEQRSDYLRVTGGYNAAEQARIDTMLARIGARRGVGTQAAQGVFGGLQAGGLSSADAAAMTDNAVKFSTATQAAPDDAANLTVALRNNMGIKAEQMMAAYDAIAMGGKAGQFEVKDMARNFPSILARLGSRGSTGMEGVRMATAFAQSVRKRSGTSDEASTSLEAMLSDMVAPDVRDRAGEYGVDPLAILADAKAKGKDPVMALMKRFRQAFGNDPKKFTDVFRNDTAGVAYQAIFDDLDEIEKMMSDMEGAKGVIDADYDTSTGNLNAQKDRLLSNVGKRIKEVAGPSLSPLAKLTKSIADAMERQEDQADVKKTIDSIVDVLPKPKPKPEPKADEVPAWKRFLFGSGAGDGFDLKKQFGISLRPAADSAMDGYHNGIAEGGRKAEAEAQTIADTLRSILGFTVTPTISPVIAPPAQAAPAATAPEKHSSLQQSSNIRLTQNITSPNPKLAAIRSRREQTRAIQMAQARSHYDIGTRLA